MFTHVLLPACRARQQYTREESVESIAIIVLSEGRHSAGQLQQPRHRMREGG